ncbi:GvpL/GvpF family gas vesicle protein [Mycobacterium sp. GA-2829]|uniref:GvpL/GvpF family gas vesicle protein n=1 Tax=Mycobacterium sp. GA-2829 TaxID=1772283 RepID=UPI000740024D|nr:GvpL/GvpF family gas vesicle protein [Mycobacterium sp. GA-2829]KUI33835.1 gas vesicle protein GvpFL [Mycobacterium sp. GA-2829]
MSTPEQAIYVYGIVPGDVEAEEDAVGVGDPPAKVEVVREGDIAALVSPIPTDHPLGTPDDLRAHANLLDGTAAVAPVLPLRFGAVVTDADAVAAELLREHHDEFRGTLDKLEGHAQYMVKGRYDEDTFLRDLLEESDQARALRDDIKAKPEEATRDSRMALGELIANTIEAKRQADTATAVQALEAAGLTVNVREPTHEWDAINVAVLAEVKSQADLEAVVDELAGNAEGRVDVKLLGPMAPYDFVVTAQPAG